MDVQQLMIEDVKSGLYFDLQPTNSTLSLGRSAAALDGLRETVSPILAELLSGESQLKKTTKAITDKLSPDFIQANSELKKIQQKIRSLRDQIREGRIMSGNYELTTHFSPGDLKNVLTDAVDSIWADYKVQYNDAQKGKKTKKDFAQFSAFNADKFKFDQTISDITDRFEYLSIAYLGATLNKQSALFAIRDKENMLAQSIHEYKQLGIDNDQGSDAYKFVQKWIKEDGFDIGASISINMHAGEAYEVMVKGNHVQVPLADKGMGSIQAMLLILRLATVIYKHQKFKKEFLVIIEEPELNLHPALQSKLATLFHAVATEFGIKFMIETHSEYLIRKTQLIVKEYEYEVLPNENPINIIYFDQEPVQWKMNYREDGRFINKFGTGFFDVSSNLTFDLL